MARACLSDSLASMAALLLDDLLSFCSLAASHPVYLAYLLFFSPYVLSAISFLSPLLLSTCFLLLALLNVSPYITGTPPPPPPPPPDGPSPSPGPFCNTLRFVMEMLDPCMDGEPGDGQPGALCDIASELQACMDSVEEMYREVGEAAMAGGPTAGSTGDGEPHEEEVEEEEKRIVSEAIPNHEICGWELEAISKLYKALTYEVEEFPIKLALRSLKEGELLPPGTGFHGGDLKVQADDSGEDLPRREEPSPGFESPHCKMATCDAGEDILLGNASKSATKSRYGELPKSLQGISRSDSDGSRTGKPLGRSLSSSWVAAGGGLARVASAREWRRGGSDRALLPESLSSSGSMRKDKEWRRTLACKLYEERIVAEGGEEGMDLLWEAYELGSSKDGAKEGDSRGISDKGRKESRAKVAKKGERVEEEEEEEAEEEMVGRLCCLQALRFSTAKVSFGMGRSSLVKVSKAVKGIGVFRRSLRSSRKGRE